jgi:uncharacterized membrane protein YhhN
MSPDGSQPRKYLQTNPKNWLYFVGSDEKHLLLHIYYSRVYVSHRNTIADFYLSLNPAGLDLISLKVLTSLLNAAKSKSAMLIEI